MPLQACAPDTCPPTAVQNFGARTAVPKSKLVVYVLCHPGGLPPRPHPRTPPPHPCVGLILLAARLMCSLMMLTVVAIAAGPQNPANSCLPPPAPPKLPFWNAMQAGVGAAVVVAVWVLGGGWGSRARTFHFWRIALSSSVSSKTTATAWTGWHDHCIHRLWPGADPWQKGECCPPCPTLHKWNFAFSIFWNRLFLCQSVSQKGSGTIYIYTLPLRPSAVFVAGLRQEKTPHGVHGVWKTYDLTPFASVACGILFLGIWFCRFSLACTSGSSLSPTSCPRCWSCACSCPSYCNCIFSLPTALVQCISLTLPFLYFPRGA